MADNELPLSDDYKQGAWWRIVNGDIGMMGNEGRSEDWLAGFRDASTDAALNGDNVRARLCLLEERRIDPQMIYVGQEQPYRLGDVLPSGYIVASVLGKPNPIRVGQVWIERTKLAEAERHGWAYNGEFHDDLVQVSREVAHA